MLKNTRMNALICQDRHLQYVNRRVKKITLTIDLLDMGIYAPGPQVSTYRPQIMRRVCARNKE